MANIINVNKKTKEQLEAERQKRLAEGTKALGEVESTVSRTAEEKGISAKGARRYIGEVGIDTVRGTQAKAAAGEQITVEEARAARAQQAQTLQQAGAFEPTPEAINLQPEVAPQGILPIGDNLESVRAIRSQKLLELIDPEAIKNMSYEDFVMNPELSQDPFFQTVIANEVDFKVLQSEEALASSFGTLVEGIPVVGGLARKYGGSLITTPSSQIDNIVSEIDKQTAYARNMREWVGMGTRSPEEALEYFNDTQERLQFLESKLKILILQSPELRSSPEEVDAIRVKIAQGYGVMENGKEICRQTFINPPQPDALMYQQTLQELKNYVE